MALNIMRKNLPHIRVRNQYGAAPYRHGVDGDVEILLVTSRDTGRWIIPKGWPIKKLGPLRTAMREAYEEAGVRGDGGPAVGAFDYLKLMSKGPNHICEVEVFPLLVREELENWPEKAERERRWFTPADASGAVTEDRLKEILLDLSNRVRP